MVVPIQEAGDKRMAQLGDLVCADARPFRLEGIWIKVVHCLVVLPLCIRMLSLHFEEAQGCRVVAGICLSTHIKDMVLVGSMLFFMASSNPLH